jgi:hypothetical protein
MAFALGVFVVRDGNFLTEDLAEVDGIWLGASVIVGWWVQAYMCWWQMGDPS